MKNNGVPGDENPNDVVLTPEARLMRSLMKAIKKNPRRVQFKFGPFQNGEDVKYVETLKDGKIKIESVLDPERTVSVEPAMYLKKTYVPRNLS